MSLTLDFSGDYADWDLTEAVTLTSVGAGGQTVAVAKALRGQPGTKERAPTGGVYTGSDDLFLLPGPLLGGVVPKPADTITDADGTVSTILHLDYDQLDQVYAVYAVDLVLALALRDSVTFWAPGTAQDAAGSRTPTFTQQGAAAPARVQLVSEQVTSERGKRLWVGTYDVYVLTEVSGITSEWQVRQGGHVYEVLGTRNRSRIDELAVVQCRRTGDAT